jgi:hypothetical protein
MARPAARSRRLVIALLLAGALGAAGEPAAGAERIFAFVSHTGGAELQRLRAVGHRLDVVAPNAYTLDTRARRAPGVTPG